MSDRRLYRAMRSARDGQPVVGASASCLGVRLDRPVVNATPVNLDGTVYPETGGMSVTPDEPMRMPPFLRPPSLGGTGDDPIWELDENALGPGLTYRPDPRRPLDHGFIEPAHPLHRDQYEAELAATKPLWKVYSGRCHDR